MNIQWRLTYQNEALVISSGLVYTNTTKPKGLTLNRIKKMIEKQPNKSYYQTTIKRRVTLGDNIAKSNPEMIGKETDFFVSIDLTHPDHDREFKQQPETGKDLMIHVYNSMPIKL